MTIPYRVTCGACDAGASGVAEFVAHWARQHEGCCIVSRSTAAPDVCDRCGALYYSGTIHHEWHRKNDRKNR